VQTARSLHGLGGGVQIIGFKEIHNIVEKNFIIEYAILGRPRLDGAKCKMHLWMHQ
jgi:hypothetical protein